MITPDYELPNRIWIYWHDPQLPVKIAKIIENNQRILQDEYVFHILHSQNLGYYLDTNTFPRNYVDLIVQHQSDYIRLRLLEKYGGIWMDASIVVNTKDDFDTLFNETKNTKADLLAFTHFKKEDRMKYHQHIDNWLLIAPKNNRLVKEWLNEFTKAIDVGFNDYFSYATKKVYIDSDFIKNGTYLTQHVCLQVILQENHYNPTIITKDADLNMFLLQITAGWNRDKMKQLLKHDKSEIQKIPYIKLTRFDRESFDVSYFDNP